jgi:hypothetical protein
MNPQFSVSQRHFPFFPIAALKGAVVFHTSVGAGRASRGWRCRGRVWPIDMMKISEDRVKLLCFLRLSDESTMFFGKSLGVVSYFSIPSLSKSKKYSHQVPDSFGWRHCVPIRPSSKFANHAIMVVIIMMMAMMATMAMFVCVWLCMYLYIYICIYICLHK